MIAESLAKLVTPSDLAVLTLAIEKAVAISVRDNPQRDGGVTGAEIKRRAKWCVDQALALLRFEGWSSERVADSLPVALKTYLETGAWEPTTAGVRMWAPD